MGILNVAARLGGIGAPMVILLVSAEWCSLIPQLMNQLSYLQDQYIAGLYMMLMGFLAAVTGVLCLSLPETLNTVLPDTIQEL